MEVVITAEQRAQLEALAAQQGRDPAELAQRLLAASLEHEQWFSRMVDEGLAAGERGELTDHEEVGKLLRQRYPG